MHVKRDDAMYYSYLFRDLRKKNVIGETGMSLGSQGFLDL